MIYSECFIPVIIPAYSFSAQRNLAQWDLEFAFISSSDGRIGFLLRSRIFALLPHTHTGKLGGHVHPEDREANVCFVIRSSKEWNVITAARPPGLSRRTAASMEGAITESSPFTSMRIA